MIAPDRSEKAEYLARVSWDSVLKYKELWRNEVNQSNRPVPLTNQYGSNQPILEKLRFGDGLWLFVAPEFGKGSRRRILPPSVLGRIEITHQLSLSGEIILANKELANCGPACNIKQIERIETSSDYKFWRGGVPSVALPVHNAFAVFKSLTFMGKKTQLEPTCAGCQAPQVPGHGPYGHLMLHFQAIRQLTDDSVRQQQSLQNKVANKKTVFLSHCHSSAAKLVSEVAVLLESSALCWWDIQVMPQNRWYEHQLLQDMLSDGIRQSAVFVAFVTPDYFQSVWVQTELAEAQKPGGPAIVPVLLCNTALPNAFWQKPIHAHSHAPSIAEAIKQYL